MTTREEYSERGRRGAAALFLKLTPEERRAHSRKMMAAQMAKTTPEERRERARKAAQAMRLRTTPEQRLSWSRKGGQAAMALRTATQPGATPRMGGRKRAQPGAERPPEAPASSPTQDTCRYAPLCRAPVFARSRCMECFLRDWTPHRFYLGALPTRVASGTARR